MAASLSELKAQIDEAERTVLAADARASEGIRSLKAQWRARIPTVAIGATSALLAFQLVRGRRRARRQGAAGAGSWGGALEQLLRIGGPRLITVATALVAGLARQKTHKPLAAAPAVDLQRYAGTWYEIARLPQKHEKECVSDVTATYEVTLDGGLRVVNRCRRRDGSIKRAIGRAEVQDPDSNARLRVTFAPQLLDALPFVWADYTIIDVASDYSTAIVGTPDRTQLWLLARAPTVDEDVRSAFVAKALGQGFDTSALVYGRHAGAPEPGAAETAPLPSAGGVQPTHAGTADSDTAKQAVPATDYDRLATPLDERSH